MNKFSFLRINIYIFRMFRYKYIKLLSKSHKIFLFYGNNSKKYIFKY